MEKSEFFDGLEDGYEIISIKDENNTEIECFIIDAISFEENKYLLVVTCEDFEKETSEAFILKEIREENDEVIYKPVESEEEYNKVLILLQDSETNYEIEF